MFNHCFYCVQDSETQKYYNKNTGGFDLCIGYDPPFLTLEEAQKIVKQSPNFEIHLHENT